MLISKDKDGNIFNLPHNHFQFAGYSADSLAERLIDGKCSVLVTAGKKAFLDTKEPLSVVF